MHLRAARGHPSLPGRIISRRRVIHHGRSRIDKRKQAVAKGARVQRKPRRVNTRGCGLIRDSGAQANEAGSQSSIFRAPQRVGACRLFFLCFCSSLP